ncbi:MAG TPA: hypothetical protein VNN21_08540 [Dehalococcoidia bacterium]|nr:hypothetical protein [Dehalococcoidia bacterium]
MMSMGFPAKGSVAIALAIGVLILLAAGSLVLGTTWGRAGNNQRAGPGLPPREKVPRPDESEAMPIEDARNELIGNASLRAVITAAEQGDVSTLLQLAVSAGDDFCSRYRSLPPECSSSSQRLPTVFQDIGELTPRPVETMKRWLTQFYAGGPSTLEFASRDSRLPAGDGGKYYLFFRVPQAVMLDGPPAVNGLGVAVVPGSNTPIQWFAFSNPDGNGLKWVQILGESDGARYQRLIGPETVKHWPDIEGQKGD